MCKAIRRWSGLFVLFLLVFMTACGSKVPKAKEKSMHVEVGALQTAKIEDIKETTQQDTEEDEEEEGEKKDDIALDEKEVAKNIEFESYTFKKEVVIIFTNNNNQDVMLTPTITFYDKDKNTVGVSGGRYEVYIAGKGKYMEHLDIPFEQYENIIKFDSYTVEFTIVETPENYAVNKANSVSIDVQASDDGVLTVTFANDSKEDINEFACNIIFYKEDNIIDRTSDTSRNYVPTFKKGTSIECEYTPYQDNGAFDRYEVIVNSAR